MSESSDNEQVALRQGLVVEDLPASAAWLCDVLEEVFPDMAVQQADCIASGRKAIETAVPQLALIDLGLPDGSGIELIRKLAHGGETPHIIVSTIYADDRHLFPALRAGATGYLLKDQSRERVTRSLRGIAAGEPPLSPRVAQRLLRIFAHEQEEPEAPLSPREREVLTLIAKGFRLPDVAETMGVTRNTAAGYVKAVYRKLNISSRAEAALEASRLGLVGDL
ncbi:response regulator transcription factor [uncultured Abyssibacter sp.]|uniref:response regulator transcription factor n=1 Tax=uncultured Abyssibacter sp. TaxID=2320202 RepID=UPI0032B15D0F